MAGSRRAASAALSRTAATVVAAAKFLPGGWAPPEAVKVSVTARAAASTAERAPVSASRRRGQARLPGARAAAGCRAVPQPAR